MEQVLQVEAWEVTDLCTMSRQEIQLQILFQTRLIIFQIIEVTAQKV
jgi:hypothetical protein